jgi:hypothetical protein
MRDLIEKSAMGGHSHGHQMDKAKQTQPRSGQDGGEKDSRLNEFQALFRGELTE